MIKETKEFYKGVVANDKYNDVMNHALRTTKPYFR